MGAKFKGENMPKDANGTELNAGDNVTLIKDLKVKGAGATLKRGTMVKISSSRTTTKKSKAESIKWASSC